MYTQLQVYTYLCGYVCTSRRVRRKKNTTHMVCKSNSNIYVTNRVFRAFGNSLRLILFVYDPIHLHVIKNITTCNLSRYKTHINFLHSTGNNMTIFQFRDLLSLFFSGTRFSPLRNRFMNIYQYVYVCARKQCSLDQCSCSLLYHRVPVSISYWRNQYEILNLSYSSFGR